MAKAKVITNLDAQASTGDNARVIIKTRLDELLVWDVYVDDPYNIRELHNLRIAAKRLRYTLEIFAPLFAGDSSSVLREVEQIQTELGALHDTDVMSALLRLCLDGEDSVQGYGQTLAAIAQHSGRGGEAFSLDPALLAHVVAPDSIPTAKQRVGLEALLQRLYVQREEQYTAFRRHWYQLRERAFAHEVLTLFGV